MTGNDLRRTLRPPVAFQPSFLALGDHRVALFLSQAFYWSERTQGGWFYKTREGWQAEIGLSRHDQEYARKILCELGVLLEERRGFKGKIYYRVEYDCLSSLLARTRTLRHHVAEQPCGSATRWQSDHPDGDRAAINKATEQPSLTLLENKRETTLESTPCAREGKIAADFSEPNPETEDEYLDPFLALEAEAEPEEEDPLVLFQMECDARIAREQQEQARLAKADASPETPPLTETQPVATMPDGTRRLTAEELECFTWALEQCGKLECNATASERGKFREAMLAGVTVGAFKTVVEDCGKRGSVAYYAKVALARHEEQEQERPATLAEKHGVSGLEAPLPPKGKHREDAAEFRELYRQHREEKIKLRKLVAAAEAAKKGTVP